MSTAKFATLKRIATENPEGVAQAISTLKQKLQDQVDNLSAMEENLGAGGPPAPIEGDPAPVAPVPGAPATVEARLAGLRRIAEEAPDQIEEALGEFYLGMDEVLALTENLADNLGVNLPDAQMDEEDTTTDEAPDSMEVEEEEPVAAN